MKRLLIVVVVIVILIIGGGLTAQIASNGNQLAIPGLSRQTNNPDASALDMAPWKAERCHASSQPVAEVRPADIAR